MTKLKLAALGLALFAAGCLSHMPPAGRAHMQIHWADGYQAAAREAQQRDKPMLVCLIAGEITGLC